MIPTHPLVYIMLDFNKNFPKDIIQHDFLDDKQNQLILFH